MIGYIFRRPSFWAFCLVLTVTLSFVDIIWAQQEKPATTSKPVVAETDGEIPGVSVQITELRRLDNDTINLKLIMTNDSDKEFRFGDGIFADRDYPKDNWTIGGIHLLDSTGKKKYLVVRDSEGNCVCSHVAAPIPAHSRMNLWAKFPAPPENVRKIGIIIPHFQPLDDVTIQD